MKTNSSPRLPLKHALSAWLVLLAVFGCQPATSIRHQTATTPQPTAAATESSSTAVGVSPTVTSGATGLPPTAFIFPAHQQPTPTCPDALPTRLIVQERGRVLEDDPRALRMRAAPGTQHPIVAQIAVGSLFFVLEGPVCGESYAWYRVRYQGEEGWVAEGDGSQYYAEPYLPG